MPHPGEYTYYSQIGEAGRQFSLNRPFSGDGAPATFMDIGVLLALLPPPPGRVLECGCGVGWLSYFLARRGYDVVGQDVALDALKLGQANPVFVRPNPVEFVCSDFEVLPYVNAFDAVVFYAALHHTVDLTGALRSVYRALKPGGVMLAIEPGLGHTRRASAEREKYDVGDRDMPPYLVIPLAREVGFTSARVYQHPGQLITTLYNYQPRRRWLSTVWKVPGARTLALLASITALKHLNGLIYLQK